MMSCEQRSSPMEQISSSDVLQSRTTSTGPPPYLQRTSPGGCPGRVGVRGVESYEGRHDGGGVAESLDGGVGPLLEVVMVARHVEGREGGATALQGTGRQWHAQPAVGRQRALNGVRQGRRGAPHGGRQRLRVLEAGEAGGGGGSGGGCGDPGAEGEVVRGAEGRRCKAKAAGQVTVSHLSSQSPGS